TAGHATMTAARSGPTQDSAHIEKWADPASAVWSLPLTSPCTKNADAPDQVVCMGTNYDYDTVDLFLPKYVAVWKNIQTKYPTVRHLDVMTYTRAPGNPGVRQRDAPERLVHQARSRRGHQHVRRDVPRHRRSRPEVGSPIVQRLHALSAPHRRGE